MIISKAEVSDLQIIEDCGKKNLPIYYDIKKLNLIFNLNTYNIICCKIDNKLSGFCIYKIDNKLMNVHIMSIAIYKEYRNKKVGTILLNYIKNTSKLFKNITLNVQINNNIAGIFYKKNNFNIKFQRKNYYDNLDCNDAYYMEYKI